MHQLGVESGRVVWHITITPSDHWQFLKYPVENLDWLVIGDMGADKPFIYERFPRKTDSPTLLQKGQKVHIFSSLHLRLRTKNLLNHYRKITLLA